MLLVVVVIALVLVVVLIYRGTTAPKQWRWLKHTAVCSRFSATIQQTEKRNNKHEF